MKRLRFKRGINVGLLPKESITVPENEYWKVLPGISITIYAKGGKAGYDEPLFQLGAFKLAVPQTVILPPGTILYNIEDDQYNYAKKRNVIGIAFEEV